MTTEDKMSDLGKILRQRRVMIPMTLRELSAKSGVSESHLDSIERGGRFPSAHILDKIAKPLGYGEAELLGIAGYLSPKASTEVETPTAGRLDPYVANVLAQEPVEIQRTIIGILNIFKSMTKGSEYNIEFREYAHRQYPELDEDIITMIEDLIERQRIEKRVR